MKASMTVEASFIIPFCFVVIMITCYLGVFLYNQSVLKMTGYECILRTMDERELQENLLKDNLIHRAKEFGEARTLGVKNLNISVKMTATKISLTYSCVQTVLESPIEVTVNYSRVYPELTLRLAKGFAGE